MPMKSDLESCYDIYQKGGGIFFDTHVKIYIYDKCESIVCVNIRLFIPHVISDIN